MACSGTALLYFRIDLGDIGLQTVDCVQLVHYSVHLVTFFNMVMNLWLFSEHDIFGLRE
jgi:hypothetical protein